MVNNRFSFVKDYGKVKVHGMGVSCDNGIPVYRMGKNKLLLTISMTCEKPLTKSAFFTEWII